MMRSLAFFNNKGGVGKTTLVYHIAWMFAELGKRVLAVDLDPQANLTSMFLDDERLEKLWDPDSADKTMYGAIEPLLEGTGDIQPPYIEEAADNLGVLIGDLRLYRAENDFNSQWSLCSDGNPRAFRVESAFYRVILQAAEKREVDLVLIDVGPNLGAINRAALIVADSVAVPLAPDIYSLQGLRNLGPSLNTWRAEWKDRIPRNPTPDLPIPKGTMKPIGYVVMQHAVRLDRPVKAYEKWMARIPETYRKAVLEETKDSATSVEKDPHCLSMLKHYRSLMPMAMEARKPMFLLKPADGAIGAHAHAVTQCYKDFKKLAEQLAAASKSPKDS